MTEPPKNVRSLAHFLTIERGMIAALILCVSWLLWRADRPAVDRGHTPPTNPVSTVSRDAENSLEVTANGFELYDIVEVVPCAWSPLVNVAATRLHRLDEMSQVQTRSPADQAGFTAFYGRGEIVFVAAKTRGIVLKAARDSSADKVAAVMMLSGIHAGRCLFCSESALRTLPSDERPERPEDVSFGSHDLGRGHVAKVLSNPIVADVLKKQGTAFSGTIAGSWQLLASAKNGMPIEEKPLLINEDSLVMIIEQKLVDSPNSQEQIGFVQVQLLTPRTGFISGGQYQQTAAAGDTFWLNIEDVRPVPVPQEHPSFYGVR